MNYADQRRDIERARRETEDTQRDVLVAWLSQQIMSLDPGDSELEYRRGWNAAIGHVSRKLQGK